MWHAQEHYNLYTQPLINLVSAHILGRVRFCLKFYLILCIFFFTKLKRKNTLIFTIQLSWYSSESMLAKIQGLFKTLSRNSRTFQGFLAFKDFSRLCEPCDGFSAKTLRKKLFHCQNDCSSHSLAGQFRLLESTLSVFTLTQNA